MDWAAVWRDVVGGLLIAGALAAWVPAERAATITEAHLTWNYTTVLNILFLMLAAILLWRAAVTGGFNMLRMMNMPPQPTGDGDRCQPRHVH